MWPFTESNKGWAQFTAEEVSIHCSLQSLWIIGGNSVYDITEIVSSHPGGTTAILRCGGGAKDCKVDHFFHSSSARNLWEQQKIGEITNEEKEKLLKLKAPKNGVAHKCEESQEELRINCNEPFSGELPKGVSIESIFLSSPDWVVYNRC